LLHARYKGTDYSSLVICLTYRL